MSLARLFGFAGGAYLAVACSGGTKPGQSIGGSATNGGASNKGGSNTMGGVADPGGSPTAGGSSAIGGTSNIATTKTPGKMPPITAGGFQTCALLSTGSVQCWGHNFNGPLGNGTKIDSSIPVNVIGISNATAVSAGHEHTCALLSGGMLQCWGLNKNGELGNTSSDICSSNPCSLTPIAVSGITNAIGIAAGNGHTCALLSGGSVQCWGYNYNGQLGNGTVVASPVPVTVPSISNAVVITTGFYHSCALLSDGSVQCWGDNIDGQLGTGNKLDSPVPLPVLGITNAVALVGGYGHSCAVLADGKVQCWGYNLHGQLGNGLLTDSTVPVTVSGISNAVAVSCGYYHTCALLSDGTARCWGDNALAGELGNGNMVPSPLPVTVSGITNATALAGGDFHACTLLSSGSIQCWGDNSYGELGNNPTTTPFSNVPVTVIGKQTPTCQPQQTLCNADAGANPSDPYCATTLSDSANCGSCGHACIQGEACSVGQCSTACQPGQTACAADTNDAGSAYCAKTLTDIANCGVCGNQCGQGTLCSNGQCINPCQPSETLCSNGANADAGGAPQCADLQTDNANCGCCGNVCNPSQGCRNGRCDNTTNYSFFVFGDIHAGTTASNTNLQIAMNQVHQIDPNAIGAFSNGDLVDSSVGSSYWTDHDAMVAGLGFHLDNTCAASFGSLARYFASVGNHDVLGGNWHTYWNQHLWAQQNLGHNGADGVYYSVTYANAFFIMLDSEHVSSPEANWTDPQTTWLASALASTEAQNAQFKFIFFHEPVYSCCDNVAGLAPALPWVDLAEKNKVNVVFGSHTHVYTRTCPKKGGSCTSDGTGVIFLETGAIGGGPRPVNVTTATVTGTDAAGNPRSDAYNCIVGQDLMASRDLINDFCHVSVNGCLATVNCYDVADGNTTPFDTWTVNGC